MLTQAELDSMPDSEIRQKLQWRDVSPVAAAQLVRYRKQPKIARTIRRVLGKGPHVGYALDDPARLRAMADYLERQR